MKQLHAGDAAPDFEAANQHGETMHLTDFAGRRLFLYFYSKANTSG